MSLQWMSTSICNKILTPPLIVPKSTKDIHLIWTFLNKTSRSHIGQKYWRIQGQTSNTTSVFHHMPEVASFSTFCGFSGSSSWMTFKKRHFLSRQLAQVEEEDIDTIIRQLDQLVVLSMILPQPWDEVHKLKRVKELTVCVDGDKI